MLAVRCAPNAPILGVRPIPRCYGSPARNGDLAQRSQETDDGQELVDVADRWNPYTHICGSLSLNQKLTFSVSTLPPPVAGWIVCTQQLWNGWTRRGGS